MTSVKIQQVQMCRCSTAGEQTFLHMLGCTCTTDGIEIGSAGVLVVQCSIISISCNTGVVLVQSENDGAVQVFLSCPSGFTLVYFEHVVLHRNVYANQWCTWHINVGAVETVLESLEYLCICLHTPVTDTTHWWHHGSYAEKVKIDKRLGLARPRV